MMTLNDDAIGTPSCGTQDETNRSRVRPKYPITEHDPELSTYCRFYYTNCTHFGASVSPPVDDKAQGYYVLHCEGPGLPLAGMHMMSSHKMVRILYDTKIQRADKLSELALPTRRNFEVNALMSRLLSAASPSRLYRSRER